MSGLSISWWRLIFPALALAGGIYIIRRIVLVGASYKAKILCSALYVSGRRLASVLIEDVSADSYRIMRLFGARVDEERKTVTVSLLGLGARTAAYRPGLGATLTVGVKAEELTPRRIPESDVRRYPRMLEEDGRLAGLVSEAFTEPHPGRLRRTRAVVVVRDGRIIAERYAPGFDQFSRVCGWSMTKSVLGALIGILVGEGRLALEQRKLAPEWSAPGDPRGEITLDDMLRMRSGLEFAEIYTNPLKDVTQMLFAQGDAAAFAAAKPLTAPPRTLWHYSSGTTNILSRLIRRTLGGSHEDYLTFPRRALFDPAGMTRALLEPDAAGNFVFSSFMYASARDWARFGQLCLQDGAWEGRRILPAGWMGYCVTPTPQSPGGQYGAHWWLKLHEVMGGGSEAARRIPGDAYFAIGHEGQVLTIIPSLNLVVVRLGMSIHVDAWNHAEFMARLLAAL
ncbi:MAG: serine hydrolase [Elusimicrobiota bacterium]